MRCEGCPVAPGLACSSLVTGNRQWCLQRLTDPALGALIVARSGPGIEPEAAVAPSIPAASVLSTPEIARIETCPKRVSSCGCLSKPALCQKTDPPIVVLLDDCLACWEAGGP